MNHSFGVSPIWDQARNIFLCHDVVCPICPNVPFKDTKASPSSMWHFATCVTLLEVHSAELGSGSQGFDEQWVEETVEGSGRGKGRGAEVLYGTPVPWCE